MLPGVNIVAYWYIERFYISILITISILLLILFSIYYCIYKVKRSIRIVDVEDQIEELILAANLSGLTLNSETSRMSHE